jgi:peroxiredoxin
MSRSQENARAPDFSLADLNGQTVRLSDYVGEKNVVLVLNRGFM